MKDRLIYLASPYSNSDPAVRLARFHAVCREAARLMARGRLVFSPIAHTHPIAEAGQLPLGWPFWERYDRRMIGACDELHVLRLDGWRTSVGVQAEIAIAAELGKPVHYLFPRAQCPRCGQHYAQSSRGLWRHVCAGLLPTMQPGEAA